MKFQSARFKIESPNCKLPTTKYNVQSTNFLKSKLKNPNVKRVHLWFYILKPDVLLVFCFKHSTVMSLGGDNRKAIIFEIQ